MNLSRLSGLLLGWSFVIFCALLCWPSVTRALFGSFLSLEGERFPLLGALLRNRLTVLCALLCCLGALRGFGLAFRFFPQGVLARGIAGSGCWADTRDELEVLAVLNLSAGSAGAV
jgi:hypothetical protein